MATCPECKGEGKIELLYSAKDCDWCNGTGDLPSEDTAKNLWDPCDWEVDTSQLEVRGVWTSPSSNPTIKVESGGDVRDGDLVVVSDGKTDQWHVASVDTPMIDLNNAAGNAAAFNVACGSSNPSKKGHPALPGSVFMQDGPEGGCLWVKVGHGDEDWERMTSGTEAPVQYAPPPKEDQTADAHRWAVEEATKWSQKEDKWERGVEDPVQAWVANQALIGVSMEGLSETLAEAEAFGVEDPEFLLKTQEFAQVRSWNVAAVRHSGRTFELFGVPVSLVPKMPFAAVLGRVEGRRVLFVLD